MIRISIAPAAFDAIADTLPLGSVAVEPDVDPRGAAGLDRRLCRSKLSAMRGPGESLSDVILRLAAIEALGPAKVDPLDELVRIVGKAEPHKPAAPKRGPDRRRVWRWRR